MEVRTNISYCSSCFQAKPGTPHVDFDAAWDGPVLTDGAGEPIQHAIDELVICEDCLGAAAELLGYAKSNAAERISELESKLSEAASRAFEAERKLEGVRRALPAEPTASVPAPVKRGPGRPRKQPQAA